MTEKYKDRNWLFNRYVNDLKTAVEIAKECGVSCTTIYRWLHKFGISVRPTGPYRHLNAKYKDRDWLYHEYVILEKSLDTIGKECDKSRWGIAYWMREHNIPRRPSSSRTENTKAKISDSLTGKGRSEEFCDKMSVIVTKRWENPEYKNDHSGENHHMYGKTGEASPVYGSIRSEETRAKQRAIWTLEKRSKKSESMVEHWKDPEYRNKLTGENHPNFKNWASREPYCYNWTEKVREYIRNLYSRTCIICGKSTFQNISKNRKWLGRLVIDHTDENKMQGCDDWEWRLAPLCQHCHGKMHNEQNHLLLQLLLINNKSEQINLVMEE